MHVKFSVLVILAVLTDFSTATKDSENEDLGTVLMVNVLYRHGNRTVLRSYPKDPYKNASYWPDGFGQLIKEGMVGQYELGKWLRQRYALLIPVDYHPSDIRVQSTDVDRTLMSALCNLAGLYEPSPYANWNSDIRWFPVPIHTVPEYEDKVLSGKKPCPRYNYLLRKLKESDWYQGVLEKNKALFEAVSRNSGANITDLMDLDNLCDTLLVESYFKMKLPEWTREFFPEPLKSISGWFFALAAYTPQLARLKIGPFIGEILSNIEKKAKNQLKPDRKMFMYSAHDTTVANLLQALNIYNMISPPYLSTVLIELRQKDNNNFVTVLYRNSSLEEPHLLTLPGCSPLCPLDKFRTIVDPIIPKNWEKECRMSLLEEFHDYNEMSMFVGGSLLSFTALIVASACMLCRKPRTNRKDIVYQSLAAEAEATT